MFILSTLYHRLRTSNSKDNFPRKEKQHKRYISLEEVSLHNEKSDIWMVIHDHVYDVSSFLKRHPGGVEVMLDCAGVDATSYFEDVGHSEYSKQLLKPLLIGELSIRDRKHLSRDSGWSTDKKGQESSDNHDLMNNRIKSNCSRGTQDKNGFIQLIAVSLMFIQGLIDALKLLVCKPKVVVQSYISNTIYPKPRGGQKSHLFFVYSNSALEKIPYVVLFVIAILAALFYVYIQKIKTELNY